MNIFVPVAFKKSQASANHKGVSDACAIFVGDSDHLTI